MRKYVPAALAQARGTGSATGLQRLPPLILWVWFPGVRYIETVLHCIGGTSFVRCPESRSVRFSEVGFVLKLH